MILTKEKLADPSSFSRREGVPIYRPHRRRTLRRTATGEVARDGSGSPVWDDVEIGPDDIRRIADNTLRRIESGEFPPVTIGHTDPETRETEQPPVVGFIGGVRVEEFRGEPAILADIYYKSNIEHDVTQYPRRSVEVARKTSPDGHIDALAILKRKPYLDLGLDALDAGDAVERYEFREEPTGDVAAAVSAIVSRAVAEAVAAALAAQGEGPPAPDPEPTENLEVGKNESVTETPPDETDRLSAIEDRLAVERYREEVRVLTDANARLAEQVERLERANRKETRRAALTAIASEGYEFDVAKHVEKYQNLSDSDFEERLQDIRENYRKRADGDGGVIPTEDVGGASSEPESYEEDRRESREILRFAQKNGITDPHEMIERYRASKRAK